METLTEDAINGAPDFQIPSFLRRTNKRTGKDRTSKTTGQLVTFFAGNSPVASLAHSPYGGLISLYACKYFVETGHILRVRISETNGDPVEIMSGHNEDLFEIVINPHAEPKEVLPAFFFYIDEFRLELTTEILALYILFNIDPKKLEKHGEEDAAGFIALRIIKGILDKETTPEAILKVMMIFSETY